MINCKQQWRLKGPILDVLLCVVSAHAGHQVNSRGGCVGCSLVQGGSRRESHRSRGTGACGSPPSRACARRAPSPAPLRLKQRARALRVNTLSHVIPITSLLDPTDQEFQREIWTALRGVHLTDWSTSYKNDTATDSYKTLQLSHPEELIVR